MGERSLEIAAAARAHYQESVSGDAWQVLWLDGSCRIVLVDALGHGPEAAATARVAVDAFGSSATLDLPETLQACHSALHGTRGAAMTLIQVQTSENRLLFAGIGNVDCRLLTARGERHLSPRRGIVGHTLPRPVVETLELPEDWLLVLHTDGVSNRFDLPEAADGDTDLTSLAELVLERYGRATDDATVLAVRPTVHN